MIQQEIQTYLDVRPTVHELTNQCTAESPMTSTRSVMGTASPINGTLESRVKATLEITPQFHQSHSENGQ
jgi:hypothetical protein